MPITVGLISLGCPKNLVDSENMLGYLQQADYQLTTEPQEADVIIVNTCAFIESAKEESIDTILQMAQHKKDKCRVLIVAGCMAQRYADELKAEIPEIDALVGVNDWAVINEVIKKACSDGNTTSEQAQIYKSDKLALLDAKTPRMLTTPYYTAYLKIAEGCNNACAYCVIPKIRGAYRSRPKEDIIAEAQELASRGVRELVVIAQDITRYGLDLYGSLQLAELLRELNKIPNLKWIRLMYMYPQHFSDELIEAIATLDKVQKYIDIPLQHISDKVLKEMNRPDRKANVQALLKKLRARIPNVCIRTTFIVGFPGETAEDFTELCEFVSQERFERAGVFAYSQEEGTQAAQREDQIDEEIKQERYHELMSIQAKISEQINQDLEDSILEVVIEDFETDNLAMARSYREAPEIDGNIYIEDAQDFTIGEFLQVQVQQGFTYEVVATPYRQ